VLLKASRVSTVARQQIQLVEAVWIEQNRQAFAREQLALFVLTLN
jgi:hypothetical protein